MVIRVQMIRSDTRHPSKRRRHQGRASCEVAGRRFEAEGPAPIYKLTTLLWHLPLRPGACEGNPVLPRATGGAGLFLPIKQ